MDPRAPVARRTRSKAAEYWKEISVGLKRKKQENNNNVASLILETTDDEDEEEEKQEGESVNEEEEEKASIDEEEEEKVSIDEEEEEKVSVDEDGNGDGNGDGKGDGDGNDDEDEDYDGEVEIVEPWDAPEQPGRKEEEKDSESKSSSGSGSDSSSESDDYVDTEIEVDDDDDDEDYVVEKFKLNIQKKDKKNGAHEEEADNDKKEETLKRKRHAEVEAEEFIVVDSDEGDDVVLTKIVNRDDNGEGSNSRRTRSRTAESKKKQKVELGSETRPFCIDAEEDDDNEEEIDVDDHDEDKERESTDHEKNLQRKRGLPRKHSKFSPIAVLANSILADDDEEEEDKTRSFPDDGDANVLAEKPCLPLKFTFGVEESEPPEKSEFEKELDGLWEEFDILRGCSEIGSSDYKAGSASPDHSDHCAKDDTGTLCREGNHVLILNEEIGIICKYCSFVKLEIKYILPDFYTYPWGRSERKESHKADCLHYDELDLEDWGYDSRPGYDPCVVTKGTVWDLVPGAWNVMYAHQREGFEFIWKNIAGGILLDEVKSLVNSNIGKGCIISHAPGTGKSRLAIVFLDAYMKLHTKCRTVLLAPKIMLDVWNRELKKWKVDIPFYDLNTDELSGKENVAAINIMSTYRRQKRSLNSIRLVKIISWKRDGGILAISYNLFESLAGAGRMGDGQDDEVVVKTFEKALLELPDLVVFDEGHTPRNKNSSIFQVSSKIKTEKRIILSGTPFQNNFGELFNTLCLVRPSFVAEFQSQHYGQQQPSGKPKPDRKKWNSLISSISRDSKSGNYKLKELKAKIEPFVHIHKGDILRQKLPGLRDFVVTLKPNDLQRSLFDGIQGITKHFLLNRLSSFISVHPSLLSEKDKLHLWADTDDIKRHELNPEAGVKMHFLMELIKLIKLSQDTTEKVLVFSQYVQPLGFIIDQLDSNFGWTFGREVVSIDGETDEKQRESFISAFNDLSSEVKVLLASIKVCGEGITLVGASRVVLLDIVWNPSVERQAICRAFRLGQKRVVSVYHLLCGDRDYEKYYLQTEKERWAEAVFSSTEGNDIKSKAYDISDDKILEAIVLHDKFKDKVLDIRPKDIMFENFGLVDEHR